MICLYLLTPGLYLSQKSSFLLSSFSWFWCSGVTSQTRENSWVCSLFLLCTFQTVTYCVASPYCESLCESAWNMSVRIFLRLLSNVHKPSHFIQKWRFLLVILFWPFPLEEEGSPTTFFSFAEATVFHSWRLWEKAVMDTVIAFRDTVLLITNFPSEMWHCEPIWHKLLLHKW